MKEENDIVIVGGGPAGTVAALAAARCGARVCLIERNNCLGGMATSGLLGFMGPFDSAGRNEKDWARFRLDRRGEPYPEELNIGTRILKGIPEEVLKRLESLGAATIPRFGYIPFNIETMKYLLETMLLEEDVEILYNTTFLDGMYTGKCIELTLGNKEGIRKFRVNRVIDASGDGDVAASLGAEFRLGRESDGKTQATTLVFRLGNVQTDPLDWLPDSELKLYKKEAREAYERGEFSFVPGGLGCVSIVPGMTGVVTVNCQHTFDINGIDPEDLTQATITGRRQIHEYVRFFRKYVKGCENCFLLDTASQLGVRETRRIMGEYVLTKEDVLHAHKFDDSICKYGYCLDIHLPSNISTETEIHLKPGTAYDIPYRCLIPKGLSNILVAGRCISTTHEALSSMRLMTCCMALGQAAGTAAALSLNNANLAELDVKVLRDQLLKQGAII